MAKAPSESRIPTFGSRIPIPGKFRFLPNLPLRTNVTQENKNIVEKPPEINQTITKSEAMSPPQRCNKTILLKGSENSDPNCTVTLDANSAEATFVMKCHMREPTQAVRSITAQDVGKRVCIGNTQTGRLKFVGEVRFNSGLWCGVELDDAVGKHDGCVKGVRYFTCRADCGILAPVNKVSLVDNCERESGPYSLLQVEDVRVNSNDALNCDDELNKTLVWRETEQDLVNNVNSVTGSNPNVRLSMVSCNLLSNDNVMNMTFTPPSENSFKCECASTPMSDAKKKYDSSSDFSCSPNNLNVTVVKAIDLHKTVNITPLHSPVDVPSLTKQNSFELDESLGILTPDQMIDFSSFMKNAGSASSDDLKSILAKHNERLSSTSRTPSSENLGSLTKDGFKVPLSLSKMPSSAIKVLSSEDLKSLTNQIHVVSTKTETTSRTPSSENLCLEIKNSIACDSSKMCDESSLMILTPEQMEMSVFDSSKTPSSENLKSILCSNRSDKTISNSRTPSSENLGSLPHDFKQVPCETLEVKEESLSLSRPCSIDLKSSSDPVKSLKITSHQTEISSPNAVENSIIDFSLGLLEEEMLATGNQFSSMIDTTTNLELPLDSISGDKIEQFKSLSRSDQTPSPEDLPLDPIDPIKPVELEIIEPNLLHPDSDPKTDVSKTTSTKTNSFITSVTSITSLDTGYQGDGEMSRPASRGADHSPMAHKPNNPALVNLQWQRAIARRQDPMTDSDFFTESDADIHEENAPRGDRRAQVIDGNLYGANAQAPAAQDIFIGNQEEMDSSGIFTDLDNNRADDFSDGERNRIVPEDKSPSEISTKSITENSQEIKEPDLDSTLVNENQDESIMEVTETDKPKSPTQSVASTTSRKNVRTRTEISKEENPSKKFKMPKRNVTSKVKTMMEQKQDIENQENRKPARKPTGRWDAVMNKISQGKEENKSKIRLKEVKSKVSTGISGGPNAKRGEVQKTETNTFAKPKIRRVRARGEVIGAPKSNPRGSSSVHSSLSDLSISQLSHNNNKSSISSVSRVTKKRETVGRCTPPVTEVLTPSGHKPTPVTSSRTMTIPSSRTREAQKNSKQNGLKGILKKSNNRNDINSENSERTRRINRNGTENNDENIYGTMPARKKRKSRSIREQRISSLRNIFKKYADIKDTSSEDNIIDANKNKLSRFTGILKKLDCTDAARSDSDNDCAKKKSDNKSNVSSDGDCKNVSTDVTINTDININSDVFLESSGETLRKKVLKKHLDSTTEPYMCSDTILDSTLESIEYDTEPIKKETKDANNNTTNNSFTEDSTKSSLKSILKNKFDDYYLESENFNSKNKCKSCCNEVIEKKTADNRVKFCVGDKKSKCKLKKSSSCTFIDSSDIEQNKIKEITVIDKKSKLDNHNRVSCHLKSSHSDINIKNINENKTTVVRRRSSIPRPIITSRSNIVLTVHIDNGSKNIPKKNKSRKSDQDIKKDIKKSKSNLQNRHSKADVIIKPSSSKSLSKKFCDTDIPKSTSSITRKKSTNEELFSSSSLLRRICGSRSKTSHKKLRPLPQRTLDNQICTKKSISNSLFFVSDSETVVDKNIYKLQKRLNNISKSITDQKIKLDKVNFEKSISKKETVLSGTNITKPRRNLKRKVSDNDIKDNIEVKPRLRSVQRRLKLDNPPVDNDQKNNRKSDSRKNIRDVKLNENENKEKRKVKMPRKKIDVQKNNSEDYIIQKTLNMLLIDDLNKKSIEFKQENKIRKRSLKDALPSYNEIGLNAISKLNSRERRPRSLDKLDRTSSPTSKPKTKDQQSPERRRRTESPPNIKKSPPLAPVERRAASRRTAATLPAKTPALSATRDQSRVTGVPAQKGGSPLRTQALPEKTPSGPPTHLLPQVQHSAKGVEALGVLVQYLVYNLDAFRTPSLKRELENIRSQWIKDKLELEETRMGYRRLEDNVSEQKLLAAQTIEEERVKFRAEIAELFEKQRKDIAELNERNKQEKLELEQRLTEENNELKNLLDLEISNRENEISLRIEAYVSEHKYRLQELEQHNEELRRNNQTAVEILREENESIREQLDEKTSLIEDLKEFQFINDKLKEEFTLKERKFEEKLISAHDEIALLKEENKKILETFKSDTKDNKLQAALGRCTQLQDEVESLRTVLDLKLAELSELRRAHGELVQAAEELPAALIRAQSLQARVEDLELQLERKTDVELQLTKENKRLQESFSQESKQNKRLTLHNEELQWKLKQNSEVVNAILQGQTPSRKSLHGSNQSLCEELASKTPSFSFSRTHHTASFNEKHHGHGTHPLERTLSFREQRLAHELDESPPSSPKVKGVVEKSDSVSWVLDMDESPEVIASRMVRRAGSFRQVTPPKSTPTKSPATKRPRTKANNLSLSASASAIDADTRYHSPDCLSNSWHYSLRTSTPTKPGGEAIRSVKLENNPDLEHESDVASLPALPSEIARKPDSLPSLPSGDLLLLQAAFPKSSAGEAMISESNSEDECSSSTSERSPSASDTETSGGKAKLQYDLFLLTESTNSEAMDCSWSEDLEV